MNDLPANSRPIKFPMFPQFLLLLVILGAMGLVHQPLIGEPQAMQESECIAPQLQSPRFASIWAITLHNQYAVTISYQKALHSPHPPEIQLCLAERYRIAAAEYNRMAREAPATAFRSLQQPRLLPD